VITQTLLVTNSEKHIALVCNPTRENEKALRITNSIAILLSGMDIHHKVYTAAWPDTFNEFTEVWIIGGDGTINWFINQYPSIQLPLSLFGGGSGNDFHWMLYGNKTIEQQVDQVLQGIPQLVDAGVCNEKLFLNGVGIGFDGAIVHDLLGKKKLAGKASYLLSILKHMVGYHEKPCVLQMPNETIKQDCFMISIANGRRYGGGFHVTPNAILVDGLLDINIVGKISPIKRMKYLPVIEKGEHLNLDFIKYRQADKILISSSIKLHAHLDGEYTYADVFDIEILPRRFSFIY
jgi:diacylglycerol kinase (ATP)